MNIELEEKTEVEIENAKYYNLIFHNDSTTHFDFVMFLLIEVIGLNEENAYDLTMRIHNSNAAPVYQGILPEVELIQKKISEIVLEEGFDFKTSIEKD